jgi:uncharacterized membrane protein YdjX (TVP38/TMEM64 family)
MRLLATAIILAALFCVPFFLWGDRFMERFSEAGAIEWIRGWGPWGWLAVIGLLMADLFLPLPATYLMAAAGYLYGALLGGIISAVGSFAAGIAGYGLCRAFGRGLAVRLAGEQELERHRTMFQRGGPWLVAASRWLPLLPEVVSCLAGLTRMPLRVFVPALACGAVPMGFVYAAIGASGQDHPRLALALSILVPPVLWLAVHLWLRRRERTGTPPVKDA